MKKIFSVILLIFNSCIFDALKALLPPAQSEGISIMWFFFWGTVQQAGVSYPSRCTSSSIAPYSSCENAEAISGNGCVNGSISKGTVNFYKYSSDASKSVFFDISPNYKSYTENCITVYKADKTVSTNSPVSEIESSSSLSSCPGSLKTDMNSGSFKCISVHSLCDSDYVMRFTAAASLEAKPVSGTAAAALPSRTESSVSYTQISGTPAPVSNASQKIAVPIGFNFRYFGELFSNAYISNGGLKFDSNYSTNAESSIFAWSTSLLNDCSSAVEYFTSGTQPNRVFTVQWKNISYYSEKTYLEQKERLNFQIKIYESSNIIELIYGPRIKSSNDPYFDTAVIKIISPDYKIFINGKNGSTSDSGGYKPNEFPATGTVYRFTPLQ